MNSMTSESSLCNEPAAHRGAQMRGRAAGAARQAGSSVHGGKNTC